MPNLISILARDGLVSNLHVREDGFDEGTIRLEEMPAAAAQVGRFINPIAIKIHRGRIASRRRASISKGQVIGIASGGVVVV
jgi:hypothetical protein